MAIEKYRLGHLTMVDFDKLLQGPHPLVVIVPVGAIEPHGPHLPLETDNLISENAAVRAAEILDKKDIAPLIAPTIPFGVTRCANSFSGAVSVTSNGLTDYLRGVIDGFLQNGVAHVCLVNNHLEPAHDAAVSAAVKKFKAARASLACPLKKRWGRTLSDEFKSGACHAGNYETSIIMASARDLVREESRRSLPDVPISLSKKLNEGIVDFAEMGLSQAYAGAPADANAEHGDEMLELLANMIVTEIMEAIA